LCSLPDHGHQIFILSNIILFYYKVLVILWHWQGNQDSNGILLTFEAGVKPKFLYKSSFLFTCLSTVIYINAFLFLLLLLLPPTQALSATCPLQFSEVLKPMYSCPFIHSDYSVWIYQFGSLLFCIPYAPAGYFYRRETGAGVSKGRQPGNLFLQTYI
jgi:hypothetical protein